MAKLENVRDSTLFAAHDIVNILVFLFLLSLPYASGKFLIADYSAGKWLHLAGLLWFYAGLVFGAFCLSRFVWTQPALDHEKLAHGYRVILVLELWCIPSIAMLAYGGMAMVAQVGGLDTHKWAYHGYIFLLATPPILMVIPRFYHKRLIRNPAINLVKEQRLALFQDWIFIFLMTAIVLAISASMIWKTALV